jgi:protein TonB
MFAEARPTAFTGVGAVSGMAPTAGGFAGAAVEAVEGWQYESPGKDPVTFTINVIMRPGASADSTGVEARVGAKDPAVKKVKDVEPVYPPAARQKRIQGVVVLETTIGKDGQVVDARVLRGIPYLSQAALDAAAQWAFDPNPLFGSGDQPTRTEEVILNFKLP